MPLPQVTREDLDAAKNADPGDTVTLSKYNTSHSTSPPTLSPDGTPQPLPRYGDSEILYGSEGNGEPLPENDSDITLSPDAKPMPLPFSGGKFPGISGLSPGFPGISGLPPCSNNPGITFSPDGKPVPLPNYVPGSYVSGVA